MELFPCSGGMAEGFRRAGIVFDLSFDKDSDACASYERNLGHRPIQMDVRDLLRMVRGGWSPGPLDLLVADPPCTPWSRAGKRLGTEDERDMLRDTAELIELLRPRAYLIGNVPGLRDSTSWHVVQGVIGGLATHGYCVADFATLDAANYGVPQHRIRPFWFGHLDGPCICWPAPTHGKPTESHAFAGLELKPWITCGEALGHLPIEDLGRPVRIRLRPPGEHSNGGDESVMSKPDAPAQTVMAHETAKGGQFLIPKRRSKNGGDDTRCSRPDAPATVVTTRDQHKGGSILIRDPGSKHGMGYAKAGAPSPTVTTNDMGEAVTLMINDKHPINVADEPSYTVTSKGDGRGAQGACALEWPWDRPATTVCRDEQTPPPGHHDASSYQSLPNAVILSERAVAILQGFPENWVFVGKTKKSRWSQLGQAMPTPLARAVAASVHEQMERARAEATAAELDEVIATRPGGVLEDKLQTRVDEIREFVDVARTRGGIDGEAFDHSMSVNKGRG